MNQYERRFFEDIHKLVKIQEEILKELQKLNKPLEVDEELKEELKNASSNYTKYIEERDLKINKAIEYMNNYDVFKEFSFPLMKRAEENQIKTSIKYEFDTSIKKDLLEILKGE